MPCSLSATSALVLGWGEAEYRGGLAGRLLGGLDLGAGRGLRARCDAAWPRYPEVIRGRKRAIHGAVSGWGGPQVVVLAAGADPLAVRLLESSPGVRTFEVDAEGMGAKARAYDGLLPPGVRERAATVEADVSSPGLPGALAAAGWDPGAPTAVVMEGICCYLGHEEVWGAVSRLARRGGNRFVLDHMVPMGEMDAENARAMAHVFSVISEECRLPLLTYMEHGEVRRRVGRLGGRVVSRLTMREMAAGGPSAGYWAAARGGVEVCVFDA